MSCSSAPWTGRTRSSCRCMFTATTARQLGAARVGLVAPYLAYMRQDKRFHEGEAVTSTIFATFLSSAFDWLVTVDPHLHRHKSLDEIYSIPTRVRSFGSAPSRLDRRERAGASRDRARHRKRAMGERGRGASERCPTGSFVRSAAATATSRSPSLTFDEFGGRMPVLVDDIVSSGRTMIETARRLEDQGMSPPICIAVHALLSPDAHASLHEVSGAVVSTNSVPHETNGIDVLDPSLTAVAAAPRYTHR